MSKAVAKDTKEAYALVPEVKACWRELVKSSGESLKYAMQIGDHLLRMKEILPRGEFQDTVEKRFEFGYRAAANYMKLARELPPVLEKIGKPAATEGLSMGGWLKLIAGSKPKRKPKVHDHALLAEQPATDEPEDDPNEHVREQIRNEAATGDINTPPSNGKPSGGTTFKPSEWEPGDVKDALGQPVPAELREAFVINAEFDKQRQALVSMKSWITQRVKHAGGKYLEAAESRIKSDIDNLDREIKFAKPFCVCVYCRNETPKVANCNACKGLGWINEPIYNAAPKEKKRAKASHQTVSS